MSLPDQFETERLILRRPLLSDIDNAYEATDESLKELGPWYSWALDGSFNPEFIRKKYTQYIKDWELYPKEDIDFVHVIYLKNPRRFLGSIGLKFFTDDKNLKLAELGYWLRTTAAGKGYMSEAVQILSKILLNYTDIERVAICCNVDNTASYKVAEKAGFEFIMEGVDISFRAPYPGLHDRLYEFRRHRG